MTWPMHDAGPTTPEPGPPGPGPDEPGPSDPAPGHGRHAAADPLPPLDGPMPGGGPSPAETTLPLALEWPAPPARPLRTARFTPSGPQGSVDAPPGWRRVPRPAGYRPPADLQAAVSAAGIPPAAGSAGSTRRARRSARGPAGGAAAVPGDRAARGPAI